MYIQRLSFEERLGSDENIASFSVDDVTVTIYSVLFPDESLFCTICFQWQQALELQYHVHKSELMLSVCIVVDG
jgi:hypothetical protein